MHIQRTPPASGSPATTKTSVSTTSVPAATGSAAGLEQALVAVVAKVRPQVVQISTGTSLGSGVIFDTNGDIVTNAHVVGSATTFTVVLADGQQVPATLVGTYAPVDLAVIRASGAHNLSPATFGDSNTLQVGDIVFAIGNPLGLASSVTERIVSYNGRAVSEGNGVTLASTIQTSAAINHGNSGGALADLDGDVIGIPTLAALDPQEGGAAAGIGFAIPSSTVKLIAPQLIATGHVTHSDRAALDIAAADAFDPAGHPIGVLVVRTTPGGAAANAGITAGEVITSLDGQKISSLTDLQSALTQINPGAKVTLIIIDQNGSTRTATATAGQLGA